MRKWVHSEYPARCSAGNVAHHWPPPARTCRRSASTSGAFAPAPSGAKRTCPDCGATVAEGEEFLLCLWCGNQAAVAARSFPHRSYRERSAAQPAEATPRGTAVPPLLPRPLEAPHPARLQSRGPPAVQQVNPGRSSANSVEQPWTAPQEKPSPCPADGSVAPQP